MFVIASCIQLRVLREEHSRKDHGTEVESNATVSHCGRHKQPSIDLGALLPECVERGLLIGGGVLLPSGAWSIDLHSD